MPAHPLPSLYPSPGEPCCNPVLEPFATPASSYHPESSLLLLDETVPLLPAQHEASIIVPTSRHSTPPQRLPGLKTVASVSSPLDSTPAFVLSTPRLGRQAPLIYEVTPTLTLHLPLASPSSTLRRSGLAYQVAYFNFAFVLITTAALVSALFNASAALLTHTRKFWSKQEDIGNNRIGTFKTSKTSNTFAHQLRLGQLTPRAPRLVFDPGGPASSSRLPSAHKDVRKRMLKTCDGCTTLDTGLPHSRSNQPSHRFRSRKRRFATRRRLQV
ncbi:hypothetical protein EDB85DRAFT_2147984 [Lactarius pseudohatsudake]|nr:hypothetical protein EDB85DRAFT_2147984 [Lactarius pseudohatsudake]